MLSKRQRIKTVREMADRLRYVCMTKGIHRLGELEDVIRKQERQHRKPPPGMTPRPYAESVPVAVDYFLVRCFADAFKVLRSAETVEGLRRDFGGARTDYLLALAIVAAYEDEIASSVHVGDLIAARDLVDYFTDIAGGE
jgi:hypothetical protein